MAAALSYFLASSAIFIAASASWTDEVSNLDTRNIAKLKEFITPLVQLSTNAYTYPSQRAVSGWSLATRVEPLAPDQANPGAHAVVYQDEQGQKLVLAFRGTLTQADTCVDSLLFGTGSLSPGIQLPSRDSCIARFNSASLDYASQAANYTQSVLRAYPDTSLLLTGHSLGASLAVLASASVSATKVLPVVAFSSPGTRKALRERSLQLVAERENQVFMFGNEWDAVMRTLWQQQVGTVCSVQTAEPRSCSACSNGATDGSCSQCVFETHGMDQLLQKLDDGGSRLQCVNNVSNVSSSSPGSSGLSPRPPQADNAGSSMRTNVLCSVIVVGATFLLGL